MKKVAICGHGSTITRSLVSACKDISRKREEDFERLKKDEVARRSADKEQFKMELTQLINKHSLENDSDTPDWILADYIVRSLEVFAFSHKRCNDWHDDRKRVK